MPRRKQEEDEYLPSTEYGMDEYDNPLANMTPEEIRQFADYVEMIQRGGYTDDFEDSSDDSESENDLYQNNFEEGG